MRNPGELFIIDPAAPAPPRVRLYSTMTYRLSVNALNNPVQVDAKALLWEVLSVCGNKPDGSRPSSSTRRPSYRGPARSTLRRIRSTPSSPWMLSPHLPDKVRLHYWGNSSCLVFFLVVISWGNYPSLVISTIPHVFLIQGVNEHSPAQWDLWF